MCKAPVKSSPSTSSFLQAVYPSSCSNNSGRALKEKVTGITFHGLAHSKPHWVFQHCLWPLKAPGYLGWGLPCFLLVLWCQYPIIRNTINIIKKIHRNNDVFPQQHNVIAMSTALKCTSAEILKLSTKVFQDQSWGMQSGNCHNDRVWSNGWVSKLANTYCS